MIPQLKAKLEAEKAKLPFTSSAFDHAVSILMPVIEELIQQRNTYIKEKHHFSLNESVKTHFKNEVKEMDNLIIELLESVE